MKTVATRLSGELEKLFRDRAATDKISDYGLMKKAIEAYLIKVQDDPEKVDDVPLTGNFDADVERLAGSTIPTDEFIKALKTMDGARKIKNSVKKGGAFHEENAIIDLKSMLYHGNANLQEIKYHIDWWWTVGLLTNVLARRGQKIAPKYVNWMRGFEARAASITINKAESHHKQRKRMAKGVDDG